ncbi:MAG: hypothetical protein UV28_C0011G0016 [Candidatus Collierbacteria bacterium GW2011_GWE2_42_48]|nr:MAG: hypothetical protein UV28_C0011G0016 [Candidatus Collierbacteria bacterium GW2011_GWE2_42_48]
MEIGNSRTKWFIIALFVIGFLVFFHFALGDVDLFFALMGVIVIASSIIFLTSRNFFKTLLGFVVVLALFAFGIWSSEKIDTAFAESQPPRQIEEIIVDGQDTSLIIPSESTEVASGEPLPTFTSGNCVSNTTLIPNSSPRSCFRKAAVTPTLGKLPRSSTALSTTHLKTVPSACFRSCLETAFLLTFNVPTVPALATVRRWNNYMIRSSISSMAPRCSPVLLSITAPPGKAFSIMAPRMLAIPAMPI